jgi:integrase
MKSRTGYLHKRGSNFYVSWRVNGKLFMKALRDDNGQPITSRREAEEAKEKFMAPMAKADEAEVLEAITGRLEGRKAELAVWDEQQNPALPISQAWTEFLASPNRPDSGPETLYQYECQWSRFAEWMKEKHPDKATLRDVTRELAEEYAGTMNHGTLSANTYNKHLGLLTLVFRVVKRKARITENPWEEIERKRLVTHSRRELTVDELRKVCGDAAGELRTLLAIGIYTGLRLGDCATLRWAEVDLPRGIIRRIPNKIARSNPNPVLVPVHPVLRDMLAGMPVEQRGEYVLSEMAALYAHRTDAVTDLVQAHFKACGIKVWKSGTGPESKTGPDSKDAKRAVIEVGFHSLRHSFVSLCRESNAPLSVVESIVGHASPAMTRHYTHVGQLAASNAIAALPGVMGDAAPIVSKRMPEAILSEAMAIAESITGKTWKAKREALLALLAS